jgi:hypothetical protein
MRYHKKPKAPPGIQEVYMRKHLIKRRKENKEFMITNHQRRNKSYCSKQRWNYKLLFRVAGTKDNNLFLVKLHTILIWDLEKEFMV